jgi:hypothetical protein
MYVDSKIAFVESKRAALRHTPVERLFDAGPDGEGPRGAGGRLRQRQGLPSEGNAGEGEQQHQGDDETSQPVLPFAWSREAGRSDPARPWMPQPNDLTLFESRGARERPVLCTCLNFFTPRRDTL